MDNKFLFELAKYDNSYSNISNIGNIDIVTIWIKILTYQLEKDRKVVYELYKISGKNLTIEELDILKKYKENSKKINMIKKYQKHQCNEQEFIEVYNIIQKPLANEILNELTKDELVEARGKINMYLKLSSDELNEKIVNMKENILELSIVDIYVLNVIIDINFTHNLSGINQIK